MKHTFSFVKCQNDESIFVKKLLILHILSQVTYDVMMICANILSMRISIILGKDKKGQQEAKQESKGVLLFKAKPAT